MAYSALSDLQDACGGAARLQNISDWNNTRTTGTPVIMSAIASADALIDSYLRKQYAVPLVAPIPQSIVEASARIAKYRLMSARGMVDQQTEKDYDADTKWLLEISKGNVSLGVNPDAPPMSARIDGSSLRPSLKDVSRAKLRGFS